MKTFLKIFIIVLLIDMALGFLMPYIVSKGNPNFLFKIIDEIISFPTSI
ncbi:MAG: hypothetical protein ABF246_07500 [Winogradskyella sp.]